MGGEQLAVVALVVAAFFAGWFARGRGAAATGGGRSHEALLAEAGAALDRAVTACRAAVGMASATGADGPRRTAVRIFDEALGRLAPLNERIEGRLGSDDSAYLAFDRALDALAQISRELRRAEAQTAAFDAPLRNLLGAQRRFREARGEPE